MKRLFKKLSKFLGGKNWIFERALSRKQETKGGGEREPRPIEKGPLLD